MDGKALQGLGVLAARGFCDLTCVCNAGEVQDNPFDDKNDKGFMTGKGPVSKKGNWGDSGVQQAVTKSGNGELLGHPQVLPRWPRLTASMLGLLLRQFQRLGNATRGLLSCEE